MPKFSADFSSVSKGYVRMSSEDRLNPAFLFVILAVAVIFFTSCILNIFIRFFLKYGSPSTPSSSPFSREFPGSETFQRRLQQLFHLHDSGLDQATIDTLPVFVYEEITGAKQDPFDCAVCLSQFTNEDQLRLLPACSHAFHMNCIDTWLLSNSTCPLCREPLIFFPEQSIESPASDLIDDDKDVSKENFEERIFPLRLGKFRGCNNGDDSSSCDPSTSSRTINSLDERRCFSMGSYQYVVLEDREIQVALRRGIRVPGTGGVGEGIRGLGRTEEDGVNGKKLWAGSKGESFSVSKIWQWSEGKPKFTLSGSPLSRTERNENGANQGI